MIDQEILDAVAKFVSNVGLPGAALILLIWGALKHFPKILDIAERQATGVEGIRGEMKEMREDVRDIKSAVLSREN